MKSYLPNKGSCLAKWNFLLSEAQPKKALGKPPLPQKMKRLRDARSIEHFFPTILQFFTYNFTIYTYNFTIFTYNFTTFYIQFYNLYIQFYNFYIQFYNFYIQLYNFYIQFYNFQASLNHGAIACYCVTMYRPMAWQALICHSINSYLIIGN
jgi:hypothetical protein